VRNRAFSEPFDRARIFCFKYRRVVASDNTVRFGGERLQLLPCHGRTSYARAEVEVCEGLDGAISVYYQEGLLATRPAPAEATLLRARKGGRAPARAGEATELAATGVAERTPLAGKPAADHPWRRTSLKMQMAKLLVGDGSGA
jgi:hypothetical protein